MKFKKGFTLAEVLITLAIIGVVAAISIPSVIANVNQQEYKTGLRKAVNVLNSAITMNVALDGETPYDNHHLFHYLQRHMSVMESVEDLFSDKFAAYAVDKDGKQITNANYAFYTTDGMRFEFSGWTPRSITPGYSTFKLYESDTFVCNRHDSESAEEYTITPEEENELLNLFYSNNNSDNVWCYRCGSYGLNNNPDNTKHPPCMVTVDVNGDRRPTPANPKVVGKLINTGSNAIMEAHKNPIHFSDPLGKRLGDVFSIMITDKAAIPYGYAAQKAMYQAQK